MYDKVQMHWKVKLAELRKTVATADPADKPELESRLSYFEKTDMAVVVSQSQNEIEEFKKKGLDIGTHRRRMVKEDLETKFKNPDEARKQAVVDALEELSLDERLFDVAIEAIGRAPSPQCEIFFGALGGAAGRPSRSSAAYPHRDAQFVMNVHGRWQDQADDAVCIDWARDFFHASAPFSNGGVYVNFLTAEEKDRVRAAYGPNYRRLSRVKRKYDPHNLFRVNQNIRPAEEEALGLTVA